MDAYDVLTRAAELIADPKNWGKGHDKIRRDPKPEWQYCARGAVMEVCDWFNEVQNGSGIFRLSDPVLRALEYLDKACGGETMSIGDRIMKFNDSEVTTHADVLNLFHRAALLAKEKRG